jgi:site-specific DNA-methyltransferase (adenine-specific)
MLLLGDCRERMRSLAPNSVDAIVTDPPYHLTSIVKRFGADDAAPAKSNGASGVYARASAGFMGQKWDGGGVAFEPETWAEAWRVLKPGGHLLAFSGSRTYHRMVCAIEDAGFEVRDQIMWVYGSGFPKSHNQGNGWGTALKPAVEPICVARKPLSEGTVAANVLKWGTGAINVGACRVATDDVAAIGNPSWGGPMKRLSGAPGQEGKLVPRTPPSNAGRWPANLIHDGSDEVVGCFPESDHARGNTGASKGGGGMYGHGLCENSFGAGDSGSAARFFYCAKSSAKDRNAGLPEGQRSTHPTVKPTALMRYLCRLVTPPGGTVLDPFMGSGSTGRGAVLEGFRFIGIEMSPEYLDIARLRIAEAEREASQPQEIAAPRKMVQPKAEAVLELFAAAF